MAKKPKRKRIVITYAEPTPERMGHGTFAQGGNCATGQDERSGEAYRLIPVIDTMAQTGKLTQRQHYGLARYRALADDRSLTKDSTQALLQTGSGEPLGLPPGFAGMLVGKYGWLSATAFLERELGALYPIAWAIAVEDMTPTQWAMKETGAREKRDGNLIYMAPRCKYATGRAILDIQMAGERLAAAIGA